MDFFKNCRVEDSSRVFELFTCDVPSPPQDSFIYKVREFSLVFGAPTFHFNEPVFFLTDPISCARHNMKLAVTMRSEQDYFRLQLEEKKKMQQRQGEHLKMDNKLPGENHLRITVSWEVIRNVVGTLIV
ncbi:hypothetical protein Ciccas_011712 [Cichlidogyrus casuarinus]|uniref:Uncharacterized protein n=1 Tax=Cichlidogyrus casuarinus TaxID=1844966 RepID=A0ABD2PQX4_9PLAT